MADFCERFSLVAYMMPFPVSHYEKLASFLLVRIVSARLFIIITQLCFRHKSAPKQTEPKAYDMTMNPFVDDDDDEEELDSSDEDQGAENAVLAKRASLPAGSPSPPAVNLGVTLRRKRISIGSFLEGPMSLTLIRIFE